MKKRKIKFKNISILILVVLFVILFICLKDIFSSLKNNGAKELVILDTIKGYDYELNENDSKYFTELFSELKTNLESKNVDEEKYAESISKLFVIDFLSLEGAVNKNDVGGVQFVYESYQESFIKKAKDTIYRYVENNIYGKRTQELPNVVEVNVTNLENIIYEGTKEKDKKAYKVTLEVIYEKDLGYQKEVNLTLIHNDKKLEIAEME